MTFVTSTHSFSTIPQQHEVLKAWFPSMMEQEHEESISTGATTFLVYNPANTEPLAFIPRQTRDDAKQMIQQASDAFASFSKETTPIQRSSLLQRWSSLILENKHDIATVMTLESGKPLRESAAEIVYGTSFLDYYAAEILRPSGTVLPSTKPETRLMTCAQPVGICGLITPWNFPLAMITRKAAPAIAAGCACVVKPSELTPLTALMIQQLAADAGIPNHVLQTITTDSATTPDIGHELCTNPAVRKISFTGSTNVGKKLMQHCSSTVKRLSLELGGNAPFVVFDDADLSTAVTAAMTSKFRNAGQTCVCSDRFLIQQSVHDDFVQELVDQMTASLVVGNGLDDHITMGPVISQQALDAIHRKVQSAIAAGATLVTGGHCLEEKGGNFYAPTVLTNVPLDCDLWSTETFGPVVAIRPFDTEGEAIRLANDSTVGLASYVCTRDMGRTLRVTQALETGMVGVNEGILSTCMAPFGGVKESGLGREGSVMGLSEYMETKYVYINYSVCQ